MNNSIRELAQREYKLFADADKERKYVEKLKIRLRKVNDALWTERNQDPSGTDSVLAEWYLGFREVIEEEIRKHRQLAARYEEEAYICKRKCDLYKEEQNKEKERLLFLSDTKDYLENNLSICQKGCRKNVITAEEIISLAEKISRIMNNPAGMIIDVYPGTPTPGYGRTKKGNQQIHIREMTTSYSLVWGEDGYYTVTEIGRAEQTSYPAELINPPHGMTGSEVRSLLGPRLVIAEDFEEGIFY